MTVDTACSNYGLQTISSQDHLMSSLWDPMEVTPFWVREHAM